jgi:hypothetical protein
MNVTLLHEQMDGRILMRNAIVFGMALLLGACGSLNAGSPAEQSADAKVEASPQNAVSIQKFDVAPDNKASLPVAKPQIAYSYTFGYRLSDGSIGEVQQKHIALCDVMTVKHCRIVNMLRASRDGEFSDASLQLVVDSNMARAFGDKLDKAAADSGGENSDRGIEAEDLSKQMVDTDARIKAKQALADRLMVLIQNRAGKVGELVEAERAFSDAQQELDAARSWMTEMQGRVSMSKIDISYNSRSPSGSGFWRPVRDSFASVGQALGGSIATLLTVFVSLVPWLLALCGIIWLLRRRGWLTRMPLLKLWRTDRGS